MRIRTSAATLLIGIGVAALGGGALVSTAAPPQAPAGAQAGRGGGRGGAAAGAIFTAADTNQDGFVTKEELEAALAKWVGNGGPVGLDQLGVAVSAAMPQPTPAAGRGAAPPQNQTPKPEDVEKMMAALPDSAPAKPKSPRKVLVLAKAAGFVHSCIPLAAKTVEAMGAKTGAWTTAVTYDPASITADNLKQFDLVFLDNTTGAFLDDPGNPAVTEARKKALLEFVRSGKGLAGIHAAGDAYHESRGGAAAGGPGAALTAQIIRAGDKNSDQKLSRDEATALADTWFDKIDTDKAGKVSRQDFAARFASVLPPAQPASGGRKGRDTQVGTWPDYDRMIGGFFKFHWLDPQLITVKIDDPKSPVTAMFHGQEFEIHDETYTFGMDTWSRTNLHVLTSIDYDKMSEADKDKEDWPRADHDYGLSWIRREGKGRVFYEAHGHSERVYAIKPMLEHVLAGMQYALGDLKADDSPSVKGKK